MADTLNNSAADKADNKGSSAAEVTSTSYSTKMKPAAHAGRKKSGGVKRKRIQEELLEAKRRIEQRREQRIEYLQESIDEFRQEAEQRKSDYSNDISQGEQEIVPFEHAQQLAERVYVIPNAPKRIEGKYRQGMVVTPEEIQAAPGIQVFGRVIRSFIYSTDIVAIRNSNADAVLAVYPFTCQPAITQALLIAAECPVFTGVAGATTHGDRSVDVALQSEMQGVTGVIANSTADAETISAIAARVDIPVVVTITAFNEPDKHRIRAGASIVNVAAGRNTAAVVAAVRADFPDIPIMASGGKTARSISATIAAGADAISFTPPSIADLQHTIMSKNRELQSNSSLDIRS